MLGKQSSEVLIVGAGPTGLLTALRLAKHGIKVDIVDKQWRTGAHGYALALHPRSLSLLAGDDLVEDLVRQGHRVNRIAFWLDGTRRGEIDFSRLESEFPFALVLPQSTLETEIESRLQKLGVKIHWNHRVDGLRIEDPETVADVSHLDQVASGYPIARLEWAVVGSLKARTRYVVAADGYHSHIRERVGIRYEQSGPRETFSVFEFESGQDSGDEVRVVFEDGLASVYWPMAGRRCRWSFQITHADQHEPTRTRLNDFIRTRAPWFPPVEGEILWSSMVQFDRRLASGMGRERVWLAGDSAHLASPVGVQSMNSGLVDACELADALAGILRENGTPELLERYGENRMAELRHLFGDGPAPRASDQAEDWARGLARPILNCVPATGGDLSELLRQIGLEFEAGGG